jgi:hypothetical protein
MDCLSTSVDEFMSYHKINPLYKDKIITYLKDSNYTIYTRLNSLYVYKHITVKLINNITEIDPHTIIGIYIKPHQYLNVFGYHYFYVSDQSIISSWYTTRNITKEEYNQLEKRERSLSETSIENGIINSTVFSLNILNELWELIHNDVDDIGYQLYQLFGGNDNADLTLKKSENKIFMYMYSIH